MLPPYYFYWLRRDNKHMTEPWLDQALMDSTYRGVNMSPKYFTIYLFSNVEITYSYSHTVKRWDCLCKFKWTSMHNSQLIPSIHLLNQHWRRFSCLILKTVKFAFFPLQLEFRKIQFVDKLQVKKNHGFLIHS